MPTFFARRYMRRIEAVTTTEKTVGAGILLLVAALIAVFILQVTSDKDYLFTVDEAAYDALETPREPGVDPAPADNPFPEPGVSGWDAPKKVSRFTPDTLYQKINGRADAYLQFHVVSLTFGTYHHATDTDRALDVYWYDMGEHANALGIYQAEAFDDANPVSIGREGYEIGGAIFFRKGSSYVQVLPSDPDEVDLEAARNVAQRLADRIEDTDDELWALTALPEARRLAGSFRYIAQDAFGLDFLREVYAADYDHDGKRVTLFIHRADDDVSAAALLDQYRGFFEHYGRVIQESPNASRRIVAGEVSGLIDVVFAKGRYLGGVGGADDAELARIVAGEFLDQLTAP